MATGVWWVSFRVSFLLLLASTAAASSLLDIVQVEGANHTSHSLALSPDDTHVYVLAEDLGAVLVLERDPATEVYTALQVVENDAGGPTALVAPSNVAVTPDGMAVLVSAFGSDALVVFSRDPVTGLLTFVEEHVDGVSGVDGLAGALEIAVSPDSASVYVASFGDDAIAVFSRDVVTGALTFVEAETAGGDSALEELRSISLSPDGLHLYAGGDTGQAGFVRDVGTGELTSLIFSDVASWRTHVVRVSPDGAGVYYLDRGKSGGQQSRLRSYARDPATGGFSGGGTYTFPKNSGRLENPISFEIRPDQAFLYVQIGPAIWVSHACCATFPSQLVRFDLDPVTSTVSNRTSVCDSDDCPSLGIDSLAFTSGSETMLLAGGDRTVAVRAYDADAISGDLAWVSVGAAAAFGTNVEAAAVSPDGEHVYTTGRRWNSLAVFDRDPVDGMVTFVEAELDGFFGVDGLQVGAGIAISPDGAHVYVAAREDDAVSFFSRDAGTGAVTFLGLVRDGEAGVDGLDGASGIAISPDGHHAYVAGSDDDALAIFARDGVTGALTLLDALSDGVGGVDGLAGATDVVLSPDGLHVYVSGPGDAAIAVFSRDAATGLLTSVEVEGERAGDFPGRLLLTPAGDHLYVSTFSVSQNLVLVAQYTRDILTGELSFAQLYVDEFEGIRGLGGRGRMVVNPDGESVYARSAHFRRIPSSGDLSFIENLAREPVDRGGFLAVSPDGRHVYGSTQRALLVYEHGFSGCAPEPLVVCKTATKSNLTVKNNLADAKRKLKWSFANGEATALTEFDPGDSRHYGFCLYDESGGTPSLVFQALVPAHGDCRNNFAASEKPCWSVTSKAKHKDRFLTPDGVQILQLTPSILPKARIKVVGKGANVPIAGLPWGLPLRAQIQNSDGGCWEQLYGTAVKNDGLTFKAKAP